MRASVFDFDGVIARSMELHAQAYRQALQPAGVHVSDEEVFRLEGRRSESLIEHFLKQAGRPADSATVARLSKEKQEAFRSMPTPDLYGGARELVRAARDASEKMAIVTGTRRENLDRMIADLMPLFDAVLAQDSYKKDKPDAEPYANAARKLDLSPKECVAIENAPFGIQSARAAGYGYVLAITTTITEDELRRAGADLVVHSHADAAQALLKVLRR